MPWKIAKEHDGFQVHKIAEDGSLGEPVGPLYTVERKAQAYLKALYSNVPDAKASEESEMKANLISGAIRFEADETNPRLLHFRDYVLARPETNKNKDRIDAAGIKELAETIAGMPIDYNHDPTKNVGFFTAGRVGSEGELRVDGAIWLDRCEENEVSAQDVYDGRLLMSIEADATTAECSVCNKTYSNESQYCDHLRVQGNDMGIRAKIKYGAERIMRGLRALGGAFTYKPAGTATGADAVSRIAFAASHMEVEMTENELTASEIAELWVNEIFAAISKREDVSDADKKRAEKEYGDVQYADEKNKKYPLDEKHIHAAWSYINMPKNAEKYSPEELKTIKDKIKRAAKRFGIEISEDEKKNEEKASMNEEEKKETPEEEKKETPEKEKEEKKMGEEMDMKAEYEAMKASVADLTTKLETANQEKASLESKLQAAETQLVEANNKIVAHEASLKTYKVNELRAKLVGTALAEEDFDANVDVWLNTDPKVIEAMTRNVKKDQGTSEGRLKMAAKETDPVTVKLY